MSVSEVIESRAVGLLTRYEQYCEEVGLTPISGAGGSVDGGKQNGSELLAGSGGLPTTAYHPGSDDDRLVDMRNLICWLNDHCAKEGMSLTTAKCYRRWLASYLEHVGHPHAVAVRNWVPPFSREARLRDDADDAQYLADKAKDMSLPSKVLKVEEDTGNTRYMTTLPSRWFKRLVDQLLSLTAKGSVRYECGPVSSLMLSVTLMTGLRPMEWPESRYHESYFDPETKLTLGPVLEVRTLKQKNRRDDNPLREKRFIVLDKWPENQLAQVKAFSALVDQERADFLPFYNRVRMTISRAWRRVQKDALKEEPADKGLLAINDSMSAKGQVGLLTDSVIAHDKRGVSIYTARHVFAEELRRCGSYTRYEIAALLGHSMLTNQVYYGPRLDEYERDYEFELPRPWPGDADDIQLWDQQVNPLRTHYAQGDLFGGMALDSVSGDPAVETGLAESFYIR